MSFNFHIIWYVESSINAPANVIIPNIIIHETAAYRRVSAYNLQQQKKQTMSTYGDIALFVFRSLSGCAPYGHGAKISVRNAIIVMFTFCASPPPSPSSLSWIIKCKFSRLNRN